MVSRGRLVAVKHLPAKESSELHLARLDGDKLNDAASNLEWKTHKEIMTAANGARTKTLYRYDWYNRKKAPTVYPDGVPGAAKKTNIKENTIRKAIAKPSNCYGSFWSFQGPAKPEEEKEEGQAKV